MSPMIEDMGSFTFKGFFLKIDLNVFSLGDKANNKSHRIKMWGFVLKSWCIFIILSSGFTSS